MLISRLRINNAVGSELLSLMFEVTPSERVEKNLYFVFETLAIYIQINELHVSEYVSACCCLQTFDDVVSSIAATPDAKVSTGIGEIARTVVGHDTISDASVQRQ